MIGGLDEVLGVAVAVRGRDEAVVSSGTDLAQPVFSVTKMFVATAVLRLGSTSGV